jgi:hypothetical protein
LENKIKKSIIIIIALVALVFISFLVMNSNTKTYHWKESYRPKDSNPYGSYLIFNLLKTYFTNADLEVSEGPVKKWLKDKVTHKNSSYVFIGGNLYYDSIDVQTLLQYASQGNNVFIASNKLPGQLLKQLHNFLPHDSIIQHQSKAGVTLNFYNQNFHHQNGYPSYFRLAKDTITYYWNYIEPTDKNAFSALGYFNKDHINFLRIPYGKGLLYFHLNPILFTNLYIKNQKGLEYAEKVFSYLPSGNIYWDEHSRIDFNQGGNLSQSPLVFILSKPSLKWAWYLLLFLVLLYLIFQAKRKQRPTPVTPFKINSSIEFTETIGRLYLQQNNHRKICDLMMKVFLDFTRNHYRISTSEHNAVLIQAISIKSGVAEKDIENIFTTYKKIDKSYPVTKNMVFELYKHIEEFHQNCK